MVCYFVADFTQKRQKKMPKKVDNKTSWCYTVYIIKKEDVMNKLLFAIGWTWGTFVVRPALFLQKT